MKRVSTVKHQRYHGKNHVQIRGTFLSQELANKLDCTLMQQYVFKNESQRGN